MGGGINASSRKRRATTTEGLMRVLRHPAAPGTFGSVVAAQLAAAGHRSTVSTTFHRLPDAVPPGSRSFKGTLRRPPPRVLADGIDGVLHFAAKIAGRESVAEPANLVGPPGRHHHAASRRCARSSCARIVFYPRPRTTAIRSARPSPNGPDPPDQPVCASTLAVDTTLAEFARLYGSARSACATSTWPARNHGEPGWLASSTTRKPTSPQRAGQRGRGRTGESLRRRLRTPDGPASATTSTSPTCPDPTCGRCMLRRASTACTTSSTGPATRPQVIACAPGPPHSHHVANG